MTSPDSSHPLTVEAAVDWTLDSLPIVTSDRANSIIRHALGEEGEAGPWEVAIRIIGDQEMLRLHEQYLNDPTPTDIMTFPYDPEDLAAGGDIVISVDTAARNAAEAGWELSEELDFLILHGLLHILGWDDQSDEDRAAMLDHQHELLAAWKRRSQLN